MHLSTCINCRVQVLLHEVFPAERYVLNILTEEVGQATYGEVHLLFKTDATKRDIIFGLIHAYIARVMLAGNGFKKMSWLWNKTQSNRRTSSNKVSDVNYVKRSQRILHGFEVIHTVQLCEGEAYSLCDQLINHPEWLIEEMHLEVRHARIHEA